MTSFISLFSGVGGLDLGLEQAGWDCLLATDHDEAAIASLNANRGYSLRDGRKVFDNAAILRSDICKLDGAELLATIGEQRGDVPLLAGGPPCQSWSSGGLQLGFGDPRGRLVDEYLRLAGEIDARWLLFENVRGLLTARGYDGIPGSALNHVRTSLFARGWLSKVTLLNAADFGVPQRRVRLFLIGYRAGDEPQFPEPLHGTGPCEGREPWVTLAQCLARVPPMVPDELLRPTGRMAAELANLPAGTGVKSPGKREATRPGGHWGYKQGAFIADPNRPARTVTASSQQDWLRDPVHGLRRLSPRECAAIQSFPANWKIIGKRQDQYRLIGNAVPPLLAHALGRSLLEACRGNIRTSLGLEAAALPPLPPALASAIQYTLREELRNGPSRRAASKRIVGSMRNLVSAAP